MQIAPLTMAFRTAKTIASARITTSGNRANAFGKSMDATSTMEDHRSSMMIAPAGKRF
jgi:hypothetical protein